MNRAGTPNTNEIGALVALVDQDRSSEAEQGARALLTRHPEAGILWKILSVALVRQGKDALQALRRTTELLPRDAEAHCNLGAALHDRGQWDDALVSFSRVLALAPNHVAALVDAANSLRALGRAREAVPLYQRAVQIEPGNAASHGNLGSVLFELRRVEEAVASFRRALVLQPDYAPAHLSLSMALRQQRRPDEAELSCRAALALDPGYAEAVAFMGELQADRGRFSDAEALFTQAIALNPGYSSAYSSIATHRKMTRADAAWLAGAEALLKKRLPVAQEISLRYSLGKYFDDIGQYADAFEHYRGANELTKRQRAGYDAAKLTRLIDQLIHGVDSGVMREWHARASDSELPVFIIGMPRSGTSLAEQILASHPSVRGAGEVIFWNAAYRVYNEAELNGTPDAQLASDMAAQYLRRLTSMLEAGALPNLARVVDKMPANFLYAGLIHAVFPQARIIHMQRHPIDTCLSIYFQNFFNIGPYANDLHTLAHYYGEYTRITRHWRAVLPAATLLEIPYEGLVDDPETWSRRMVDFIGLPWDRRCLNFHETERVVITASKWQVRQKINKASAGRWRNYEKFIDPLRQLLEVAPAGLARASASSNDKNTSLSS